MVSVKVELQADYEMLDKDVFEKVLAREVKADYHKHYVCELGRLITLRVEAELTFHNYADYVANIERKSAEYFVKYLGIKHKDNWRLFYRVVDIVGNAQ